MTKSADFRPYTTDNTNNSNVTICCIVTIYDNITIPDNTTTYAKIPPHSNTTAYGVFTIY